MRIAYVSNGMDYNRVLTSLQTGPSFNENERKMVNGLDKGPLHLSISLRSVKSQVSGYNHASTKEANSRFLAPIVTSPPVVPSSPPFICASLRRLQVHRHPMKQVHPTLSPNPQSQHHPPFQAQKIITLPSTNSLSKIAACRPHPLLDHNLQLPPYFQTLLREGLKSGNQVVIMALPIRMTMSDPLRPLRGVMPLHQSKAMARSLLPLPTK